MTIAQALVEATKCSPQQGEDVQAYLDRLVRAANALGDGEFEQLPSAAQKWMDDAVGVIESAGEGEVAEIPEPKGLDKVMKATNGGDGEPATAPKKSKKAAAAKKPAAEKKAAPKKAAGKAAKKAKPSKAKGGRPRMAADTKVHWKTKPKDVPPGNRNKYFDKIKEGVTVGELRKTKKFYRVARYLSRKGFIELVGA